MYTRTAQCVVSSSRAVVQNCVVLHATASPDDRCHMGKPASMRHDGSICDVDQQILALVVCGFGWHTRTPVFASCNFPCQACFAQLVRLILAFLFVLPQFCFHSPVLFFLKKTNLPPISLPNMRRVTCSRCGWRPCAWTWLLQRNVIHDTFKLLNGDVGFR